LKVTFVAFPEKGGKLSKTPEVKIQSGHTAGIAKRMPLLLSLGIVANRRISQYRLHSGFLAGQ